MKPVETVEDRRLCQGMGQLHQHPMQEERRLVAGIGGYRMPDSSYIRCSTFSITGWTEDSGIRRSVFSRSGEEDSAPSFLGFVLGFVESDFRTSSSREI